LQNDPITLLGKAVSFFIAYGIGLPVGLLAGAVGFFIGFAPTAFMASILVAPFGKEAGVVALGIGAIVGIMVGIPSFQFFFQPWKEYWD